MGSRTAAVATLALLTPTALLGLTGCAGSANPAPPSTAAPTTAPITAPTAVASGPAAAAPTPPAMPGAARAHTRAGAKAFVRYFWDVVDYAQATGDTSPITSISVPGCRGCEGGRRGIDAVYRAGGVIRGGRTSLSHASVDWLRAGDLQLAHVTVDLTFTDQTVDMPGTTRDRTTTGGHARDRLELLASERGWDVAQLVVLP
jgi:hypothetical protein